MVETSVPEVLSSIPGPMKEKEEERERKGGTMGQTDACFCRAHGLVEMRKAGRHQMEFLREAEKIYAVGKQRTRVTSWNGEGDVGRQEGPLKDRRKDEGVGAS